MLHMFFPFQFWKTAGMGISRNSSRLQRRPSGCCSPTRCARPEHHHNLGAGDGGMIHSINTPSNPHSHHSPRLAPANNYIKIKVDVVKILNLVTVDVLQLLASKDETLPWQILGAKVFVVVFLIWAVSKKLMLKNLENAGRKGWLEFRTMAMSCDYPQSISTCWMGYARTLLKFNIALENYYMKFH